MKNKILVYDDNCPLCTWYSGAFVKCGLLPTDGRKAFSTLEATLVEKIDFDRSRNEIPLLDTENGKVLYGIDALLEILDQKIPWVKRAGNFRPVKWFLSRLYKFISYNRKVIVAKKCGTGYIDCAPDLNYFYRLLFMVLFFIFNSLMLIPVHHDVLAPLSFYHLSLAELQAAHLSLVLVNCILACTLKKSGTIEYLGQVNMLALLVILMLTPVLLLQNIFHLHEIAIVILLITISVVICREYLRRMNYAAVLVQHQWLVSVNFICLAGFLLFLFK